MRTRLTIGLLFALTIFAYGQSISKEYIIPKTTLSPDHRYGVTVPIFDQLPNNEVNDDTNRLVEMKGGRVVAVIKGVTGWDRALNFLELAPARWSEDGSLLLWEVRGKWCPSTLTLLKINAGKLEWQTDVLKVAQQAILARTKTTASPREYAAAKKANEESGSAFPEGFTINVKAVGPIETPLHVEAALTSNPKHIDDFPNLSSYLEGVIDTHGKLKVTEFHLKAQDIFDNF